MEKQLDFNLYRPKKDVVYIYGLRAGTSSEYRYIGQTWKLRLRYLAHLRCKDLSNPHKNNWIQSVILHQEAISIDILEVTNHANADSCETRWMLHYKEMGHHLTNLAPTGGSMRGYKASEESILKRRKKDAPSQVRGISFNVEKRKWFSQISVDHIRCHIGVFNTEEEAIQALEKTKILSGEDILLRYASGAKDLSANWTPAMRSALSDVKRGRRSSSAEKAAASRYLGVSHQAKTGNWRAEINAGNGERLYLGSYETERGAASAYNRMSREVYGSSAVVNTIQGGEIMEPAKNMADSHFGTTKPTRTSKYPGVSWNTRKQRWMAQFTYAKKRHIVGQFVTEDMAYEAYKKAVTAVGLPVPA